MKRAKVLMRRSTLCGALLLLFSLAACHNGPSTVAIRVDAEMLASSIRSLWLQNDLPTFLYVNSKESKQLPSYLGDLELTSGGNLRYLYSREWHTQTYGRQERHMRVHFELVQHTTGARIRATMSDGNLFVEDLKVSS